ncbi:membrane lipoprotein lipid attachment site-containing protein [Pontibacter flavimaris]|uniref:Type IV secretion system putative lipoprotein virB7 n=1 Tax=Pontibacter flavimaris TaxID=1797110 RepID=A0A1Q5PFR3_9BACT|nr:membrane lipoprotein lipid attachment site-containing protein [Pontibacter flavimaris]OKL41090.1 hypothetical protein A3841_14795 [Pontibacter flavimaris]
MKKLILALSAMAVLTACATQKQATGSNQAIGDTRTAAVAHLDDRTYRLTAQTDDKTYGYEQQNAIKVGGAREQSGPLNERRFLNALLGPNGEAVGYYREGSCCAFDTPNGLFGNAGMLDLYKVYWEGGTDTLSLYLNMYDEGDLLIPVGFTARKE